MRTTLPRALKIDGSLVVGILALALLTLRLVGFEPQYLDPQGEEFQRNNRIAWPGLWLTGEAVREVVRDWDFVNHLDDPERRDTVMLETRTWYGIPHSVTIGMVGRGDTLYIHTRSGRPRTVPTPNLAARDVKTAESIPSRLNNNDAGSNQHGPIPTPTDPSSLSSSLVAFT